MAKQILQIEQTSSSEFIPTLIAEIRKVLKEEQNKKKEENVLLTREETAKMLNVSLVTLWDWTKKDIIPAYRIGYKVRYKKSEVLQALKKMNQFDGKK